MHKCAIPAFIPGKGGKKHVFYDLQMEVEAAKDDQVSDFFSTRLNLKDPAVLTHHSAPLLFLT